MSLYWDAEHGSLVVVNCEQCRELTRMERTHPTDQEIDDMAEMAMLEQRWTLATESAEQFVE